jgi:hypothetical protein
MPLRQVQSVGYFASVLYGSCLMVSPMGILEKFGRVILLSDEFFFEHTDYYTPEMGPNLKKFFVGFDIMGSPEMLVKLKHQAIKLEDDYRGTAGRLINIDPGYTAREKVVVASTKNFTHRIYIGEGLYADMQFMRRKGAFSAMPWTYADYKSDIGVNFFNEFYSKIFLGEK